MNGYLASLREHALFWRFTSLSLVAFLFIVVFVFTVIPPAIEAFFVTETERQVVVFVNRSAQLFLRREDFSMPMSPEAAARLAAFAQALPVRGLTAVVIYDRDGRELHATEGTPDAYMAMAAASPAFAAATEAAATVAFTPEGSADAALFGARELFDTYIPVTFGSDAVPVGVVHTVSRTGLIREAIRETQVSVTRRILVGLIVLYAALSVIVWRASRTIVSQANDLRRSAKELAASLVKERELSKVKDDFLATASHQLKTPVSEIGWAIETLHEEKPGSEVFTTAVQSIDVGWHALQSIVANLLTASEIGFRYEMKDPEPVDLVELTQETLLGLAERAKERGVRVRFEPSRTLPPVRGNRPAIEKVARILVDNAITYSRDGGEVRIEAAAEDGTVGWRVHDQGIGIPAKEHAAVFQQFFRARNAVERKNVGSGLGLFIAKTIIEGHGGSIGFTSSEERGTTFFFVLPAAKVAPTRVGKAGNGRPRG